MQTATEELGSMLDFFLLTHQRSSTAEILVERMPLIVKMPGMHIAQPLLSSCVLVCTDFFPDAEVADEKAALRLIDIKQCRLRLSQSSSDQAPPLLNLRVDRSLSHDRPSSEKCSAPIHHHRRLSGYHNLVGQRSHTCVPIELSLRSSCKLTA